MDPKSILCQFFKAGNCQKGAKCKFSHDPEIERKAEKIDLYSDQRKDTGEDGKPSGMGRGLADAAGHRRQASALFTHGRPRFLQRPTLTGHLQTPWRTGTRPSWKRW